MRAGASIETDRIGLSNAWGYFRERLRQQRGERKRAQQQSLVPMLEELLLEVKEGFDAVEVRASVKFGRVSVVVERRSGDVIEVVAKERG